MNFGLLGWLDDDDDFDDNDLDDEDSEWDDNELDNTQDEVRFGSNSWACSQCECTSYDGIYGYGNTCSCGHSWSRHRA